MVLKKHGLKRNILFGVIFAFLGYNQCAAAPACYENAKIPAHEFIFQSAEVLDEVTALTTDGQECVQVKFWQGEPLFREKLYMPFGKLYEAYARAIENRDITGARKLFAYGRPTPRDLELFLPLYTSPPGHPMPWGKEMFKKIMRILQPFDNFGSNILNDYQPESERNEWPALFFLMGGELYPDGKWIEGKNVPGIVYYFFPQAWIEKNNGKIRYNP